LDSQAVWPILYLDALFLKARDEGRVIKKALYIAVGVNLEGRKELLGLWLGEGEGAKFYLQLLNELASRGVEDIFIASVDGLKGLPEGIVMNSDYTKILTRSFDSFPNGFDDSRAFGTEREWKRRRNITTPVLHPYIMSTLSQPSIDHGP